MKPVCAPIALCVLLIGSFTGTVQADGADAYSDQKIPSNDAFNIKNYAGKVVYVDLWASWCIPCRDAFPFMADMSNEFGDDLAVVAINVDEERADAQRFLDFISDSPPPFEIIYDNDAELVSVFEPVGMPTSYIFDRDGNLLKVHSKFKDWHIDGLRKFVADAIALPVSD